MQLGVKKWEDTKSENIGLEKRPTRTRQKIKQTDEMDAELETSSAVTAAPEES
jgi:hypothetical protein